MKPAIYASVFFTFLFACLTLWVNAQDPFQVNIAVTGLTETQTTGSITLTPSGGTAPYSYAWEDDGGNTSNTSHNLGKGLYEVTITDTEGNTVNRVIGIGYKMSWKNVEGMEEINGVLTKTAPTGWGNATAESEAVLFPGEDGWVQSIVSPSNYFKMYGFTYGEKNPLSYTSIESGFYEMTDIYSNEIRWREGAGSNYLSGIRPGDVIRLSREGDEFKYYVNGALKRSTPTDRNKQIHIITPASTEGSTYEIQYIFGIQIATDSQLTLNFTNLPKTDITINGPGLTKIPGISGEDGEPYVVKPTAPATGNTNALLVNVLENSNAAGNNAPMDLKILYDHALKITNVLLVDGENEQPLSPSWYTVEEERKLIFKKEESKKELLPISTNLKGVLYDQSEPFNITIEQSGLFSNFALRVYDQNGNPVGADNNYPLEWDGTSASAGLYKFELDLTPTGGASKTFKGQFIVK